MLLLLPPMRRRAAASQGHCELAATNMQCTVTGPLPLPWKALLGSCSTDGGHVSWHCYLARHLASLPTTCDTLSWGQRRGSELIVPLLQCCSAAGGSRCMNQMPVAGVSMSVSGAPWTSHKAVTRQRNAAGYCMACTQSHLEKAMPQRCCAAAFGSRNISSCTHCWRARCSLSMGDSKESSSAKQHCCRRQCQMFVKLSCCDTPLVILHMDQAHVDGGVQLTHCSTAVLDLPGDFDVSVHSKSLHGQSEPLLAQHSNLQRGVHPSAAAG